ncbi:MAG TPA: ATP-binding protein [Polyangiaceae bacterium]|nr:ATP-binding protein [Polyangiaceae bacterium]
MARPTPPPASFPASDQAASLGRILSSGADDRLVSDLIDALPLGVVVLDEAGRVVRYNAYEQAIAGRPAASVLGRDFFRDVAPCTAACDLVPAFDRYARGGEGLAADLSFQFPFPHVPKPRDVRLRLRGFPSGERRFAFLLIEDVTEEVEAQRLRELLATLVAHDMKNPLAALRLNVDMVLREFDRPGRARDRLTQARLAADRLDRMIRLFLDVYRLEHAELAVQASPVDPRAVVDEVVRMQAPLVASYGLAIEARGAPPRVATDAGLLSRVIENLVDNALRHARSSVVVELAREGARLRIDVVDDGPGVPDEAKAKVFDKFASMSVDLRGYNQGLGLTFCTLAVDKLGGTIEVLDAPAGGAIFRVLLPAAT